MATYLFDFDGTLVDSMPTYVAAVLRVLDDQNIKYDKKALIKTITPLGFGGTARYYIENFGLTMDAEKIVAQMHKNALEGYLYSVPAKQNVIATLHATLDPCLRRLGIYDLFSNVWSCEDFATTKADVNIYLMAAEKLGVPVGEMIFLDDNYNADLTAKRAGAKVVGVYDESSAEYEGEIRGICDAYIHDFYELIDLKL